MKLSELTKALNDASEGALALSSASDEERQAFMTACDKAKSATESPVDTTVRIIFGAHEQVALRLGIEMGLFTELAKAGELEIEELAKKTDTDALLANRVMRLLVGMGLAKETAESKYAANNLTPVYAEGSPLAFPVLHITTATESLVKLPEYFRKTNYKNPVDAFDGPFQYAMNTDKHYFDWIQEDPAQKIAFNAVMAAQRMDRGSLWFDYYPVEDKLVPDHQDQHLIVDVGGGEGQDLEALHKKYPKLQGRLVVEDLPWVIDGIQKLDSNIERVKHDFFQPQPVTGAKAYYLGTVLHDWPDKQAKTILKNIRDAMTKDSILLVYENALPDSNVPLYPAKLDFLMMSLFASGDRTYKQLQQLLEESGFKVVKVWQPEVRVRGSGTLFEAVVN